MGAGGITGNQGSPSRYAPEIEVWFEFCLTIASCWFLTLFLRLSPPHCITANHLKRNYDEQAPLPPGGGGAQQKYGQGLRCGRGVETLLIFPPCLRQESVSVELNESRRQHTKNSEKLGFLCTRFLKM